MGTFAAAPAFDEATALMRSLIQRVATGPELSKDISREEARAGMRLVLDGAADPVQAGIFLIALRMKRETLDENLGILEAIGECTLRATAQVDEVVDLAEPYDGYARTLPTAPFLPAVLAACGVATVSHGVDRMGPKFGITHRQVLAACGVPVDLDVEAAARRLSDPRCGWAYVDQQCFCPPLHALASLRTRIVKRPAITTVETLLGPIRGRQRTHLVTGYVHKPYPPVYAALARASGFSSALIVRGVEGGVVPSMRAGGRAWAYHDFGEEVAVDLKPAQFGIAGELRAPVLTMATEDAAVVDTAAVLSATREAGLAALAGALGPMRDNLVCAAATVLWHLRRHDSLQAAADAVRAVLDDGAALARLTA
jgi:anthranilate phosphoribosyltransferase